MTHDAASPQCPQRSTTRRPATSSAGHGKFDYEKDGAAIYRQSFATIRAEADLAGLPADV